MGRLYLFTIIKEWLLQNVTITKTTSVYGDSYSIGGLNDTQQDQLMAWFGPGTYVTYSRVPWYLNIWQMLFALGVKTITQSSNVGIFGYG